MDFEKMARVLKDNYTLEDVFLKSNFQKMLQDLSDSSLIFHGLTPVPVKIFWGSGDDKEDVAYISNTECVINLNSALDKDLGFQEIKSSALGKLTHEVFGHGLFTDFSLMEKISEAKEWPLGPYLPDISKNKIEEMKSAYNKNKQLFLNTLFDLINIVEDPTIEQLATQLYQGFKIHVDFLNSLLRKYLRDKPESANKTGISCLDEYQTVSVLFLKQARNMDVSEYYSKYPELKNTEKIFLDLSSMPEYSDRVKAATFAFSEFWKYIKPLFDLPQNNLSSASSELLKDFRRSKDNQRTENGQMNQRQSSSSHGKTDSNNQSNSNNDNKGASGSDSSQSDKVSNNNDSSTGKNEPSEQKGNSETQSSSSEKSHSEKNNQTNNGSDKQAGNHHNQNKNDSNGSAPNSDETKKDNSENNSSKHNNDKQIQRMLDEINAKGLLSLIKEIASSMDKDELSELTENMVFSSIVNNNSDELGNTSFTLNSVKQGSIDIYNLYFTPELKRVSKTLSKKVVEALKIRRKGNINYNLEEGQFIDLESVANGSDRVFMDINLPNKTPLCSVEVMIDLSGSMSGDRALSAMKTAMVLEKFCRDLKIPIDIFGHHYGYKTEIFKFKEFKDKTDIKTATKLLNITKTDDCNHDGVAYLYGIKNLVSRNEPVKIFFILSDGQPNADGFGTAAMIEIVKKSQRQLKRNNITVVPIALDSYSKSTIGRIYGTVVDGTDLQLLPKTVSGLLLKKIKKNI